MCYYFLTELRHLTKSIFFYFHVFLCTFGLGGGVCLVSGPIRGCGITFGILNHPKIHINAIFGPNYDTTKNRTFSILVDFLKKTASGPPDGGYEAAARSGKQTEVIGKMV